MKIFITTVLAALLLSSPAYANNKQELLAERMNAVFGMVVAITPAVQDKIAMENYDGLDPSSRKTFMAICDFSRPREDILLCHAFRQIEREKHAKRRAR